jgi:hypothetical protein
VGVRFTNPGKNAVGGTVSIVCVHDLLACERGARYIFQLKNGDEWGWCWLLETDAVQECLLAGLVVKCT